MAAPKNGISTCNTSSIGRDGLGQFGVRHPADVHNLTRQLRGGEVAADAALTAWPLLNLRVALFEIYQDSDGQSPLSFGQVLDAGRTNPHTRGVSGG